MNPGAKSAESANAGQNIEAVVYRDFVGGLIVSKMHNDKDFWVPRSGR